MNFVRRLPRMRRIEQQPHSISMTDTGLCPLILSLLLLVLTTIAGGLIVLFLGYLSAKAFGTLVVPSMVHFWDEKVKDQKLE